MIDIGTSGLSKIRVIENPETGELTITLWRNGGIVYIPFSEIDEAVRLLLQAKQLDKKISNWKLINDKLMA